MFSTLFTVALLAASAFADFAVNTPTLTQCQDAQISWQNTKAPYNIIAVPSQNPCGDALADLGDHNATSITWKVALLAGTKVQLSVEDANGDEAWSGIITVAKSSDVSCISPALLPPASSKPAAGSTVVVTPTQIVPANIPATTPVNVIPSAVGAAGANPLGLGSNGALTMRQASTPVMVLGALAAILAVSL